jgi:hypothetical protein
MVLEVDQRVATGEFDERRLMLVLLGLGRSQQQPNPGETKATDPDVFSAASGCADAAVER